MSPALLVLARLTVQMFLHQSECFICPSDGEEGKNDDEKLPERHEPPGKEGRIRSARV